MQKKLTILFLICSGVHFSGFSQSLNVDFLFNPGFTLETEYLAPSVTDDSLDFQLSKTNFRFTQPLKTKLGIDLKDFNLKKMDAKASQLFLEYHLNVIQPNMSNGNSFETLYKGGVGLTAITASVRKGIWIYSANIYGLENESTLSESFTPNFQGYLLNIKTKNLKTFYFYGGGFLVQQGRLIPFPLLGIKTKLTRKLRFEVVAPVYLRLNYRMSKKVSIDGIVGYNGINTVYRQGSAINGSDESIYLRQLKTCLSLNAKLGKRYKFKLDVGYSSLQKLYAWGNSSGQRLSASPFIGVAVNYNFGKSVFGNFMTKGS